MLCTHCPLGEGTISNVLGSTYRNVIKFFCRLGQNNRFEYSYDCTSMFLLSYSNYLIFRCSG